jgi:hypothetical protein
MMALQPMMVEVVLGGTRYLVARRPAIPAARWRREAEGLLEELPALAQLYQREAEPGVEMAAALLELYTAAGSLVEKMLEVVLAAAEPLAADRARIEATVTEEELLEGLSVLLLLNAPLAGMASAVVQPPAPGRTGAPGRTATPAVSGGSSGTI